MDTKIILKRLGFEEVHTGGGCTALQKCFEDGTSILITDGDASIEDGLENGLCIGFENADGQADLQVEVKNPKDIIKLVEEENRYTKGLDMILNSKFKIHGFKNYDLARNVRKGWTGNLWRLGYTAHVARLDNDGTIHGTKFDWVSEDVKEAFIYFCKSLPHYTQKERLDHYGADTPQIWIQAKGQHELIFSEEVVVDILANVADQKQKEGK
tara:strand:+ start:640 stop:1275 length:636 start_codon:yes stop_codon:yes gene_type:complete